MHPEYFFTFFKVNLVPTKSPGETVGSTTEGESHIKDGLQVLGNTDAVREFHSRAVRAINVQIMTKTGSTHKRYINEK